MRLIQIGENYYNADQITIIRKQTNGNIFHVSLSDGKSFQVLDRDILRLVEFCGGANLNLVAVQKTASDETFNKSISSSENYY